MKLGEYINQYIKEHGLSMRQFGDSCGLSHQTISYIINDKMPNGKKPNITSKTSQKIAKALGFADVDELLNVAEVDFAWGKRNSATVKSSEEDSLLEAWSKASKEDKFAVYAVLRKYGMPEPVSEDTTAISAS